MTSATKTPKPISRKPAADLVAASSAAVEGAAEIVRSCAVEGRQPTAQECELLAVAGMSPLAEDSQAFAVWRVELANARDAQRHLPDLLDAKSLTAATKTRDRLAGEADELEAKLAAEMADLQRRVEAARKLAADAAGTVSRHEQARIHLRRLVPQYLRRRHAVALEALQDDRITLAQQRSRLSLLEVLCSCTDPCADGAVKALRYCDELPPDHPCSLVVETAPQGKRKRPGGLGDQITGKHLAGGLAAWRQHVADDLVPERDELRVSVAKLDTKLQRGAAELQHDLLDSHWTT